MAVALGGTLPPLDRMCPGAGMSATDRPTCVVAARRVATVDRRPALHVVYSNVTEAIGSEWPAD